MSYFVTSDSHFNSGNIIEYCNRPFTDSDHQTAELIKRWNSVVSPDDTVIHMGDFIMGLADTIPIILPQLNGSIILTRGNHDTPRKLSIYEQYPDKITVKDVYYLPYKSLFFIFCHFPMVHEDFLDMVVRDNSEVVYCHGHVHDKTPFFNADHHSFNCCVDVTHFTPVPLDGIYKQVKSHFIERGIWQSKPVIAENQD